MENLEKSWNFKMVISRPGKVLERIEITKVTEKSWTFFYIHLFIDAEFEIINMLLKERRSKYKPAYSRRNILVFPLQVNAPQLKSSVAIATVASG